MICGLVSGCALDALDHHFGTNDGLLEQLLKDTYARYRAVKDEVALSGDRSLCLATSRADADIARHDRRYVMFSLEAARREGARRGHPTNAPSTLREEVP